MRILSCFLIFGSALVFSSTAKAWNYRSLPSFSEAVLSDTTPFVFNPSTITEKDFEWEFVPSSYGKTPEVKLALVPGSFQWVRTNVLHLLPRARLRVESSSPISLKVSTARTTPKTEQEILVSLVREPEAEIQVYSEDGKILFGTFKSRFKAGQVKEALFISDSSCSSQRVQASKNALKHSFMHVACRVIHTSGEDGDHPSLELFVYWDFNQKRDPIWVNGTEVPAQQAGLYVLRVNAASGPLHFKARASQSGSTESQMEEVIVTYGIPNRFHNLGISGGIGPYRFQASGVESIDQIAPVGTLYVSYFLNEGFKLASFWMFPVSNSFKVDAGFFMVLEQFRGIDERVSLNLLIGMQFLQLYPAKLFQFASTFAQGVELTFRDFFIKGYDGSIGGFFYPKITNEAYINSWARFGRGPWFIELNYVTWELLHRGAVQTNSAFGLSLGFPIGRFL